MISSSRKHGASLAAFIRLMRFLLNIETEIGFHGHWMSIADGLHSIQVRRWLNAYVITRIRTAGNARTEQVRARRLPACSQSCLRLVLPEHTTTRQQWMSSCEPISLYSSLRIVCALR